MHRDRKCRLNDFNVLTQHFYVKERARKSAGVRRKRLIRNAGKVELLRPEMGGAAGRARTYSSAGSPELVNGLPAAGQTAGGWLLSLWAPEAADGL